MRDDMNKVVIERTRYGGKGGPRKSYDAAVTPRERRYFMGVEEDFSPKQESMRRKHIVNGDPKEFSDLLGPLEGFLRSKDGEPWDEVWSEVCDVLKGNGLQAAHIKGHIKQMVNGIPHSGSTFFDPNYQFGVVRVDEDGIVRKIPRKAYRYKKPVYQYYRESDTVEYHKMNGCWFRVEIVTVIDSRTILDWRGNLRTTKIPVHTVIKKRTLSKKEAIALDLENKRETIRPKVVLENTI